MTDSRPSSRASSRADDLEAHNDDEGFVALGASSSSSSSDSERDSSTGDFGGDWTDDADDIDLDALLARAKLSAAKRAKKQKRKSTSKSASPDAEDAERDGELDVLLFEEDANKDLKLPPLDPGALPAPYIEWDKKKGLTIRNLDAELLIESTATKTEASSSRRTLDDEDDEEEPVASTSKLQIAAPAPPEPAFELDAKGRRVTKRDKKERKTATAGAGWFDLPAPPAAELPRLQREVEAMRLRNQLDPKRFYRKEDGEGKGVKGLPKYFAIGKIVSTPSPFGAASADNLPRAARKRTVVDELVDDAEARRYAKRKFGEFTTGREARGRKTLRDKKAARQGKW